MGLVKDSVQCAATANRLTVHILHIVAFYVGQSLQQYRFASHDA